MKYRFLLLMLFSILIYFLNIKMLYAFNFSNMTSYKELRYNYMFEQTFGWSCGPASVATLLHYYYGIETSEEEVVQLVIEVSENDDYLYKGIDLLMIKNIFSKFNIESIGYRTDIKSLSDYYDQGGLPLILYLTVPEKHFVVGIGKINNNQILIADPSYGYLVINLNLLEKQKGFDGIVMVTIPSQENHIRKIKFMQDNVLEIYRNRNNMLNRLKNHLR